MEIVFLNDNWLILQSSVQGNTHISNHTVKQDYVDYLIRPSQSIITSLADGHGSKECFRSHKGSRFAVTATIEECDRLFSENYNQELDELCNKFELVLPSKILQNWTHSVVEDIDFNPYTIEHICRPEVKEKYSLMPYGTTICSVVVTKDFIYSMQLGDSDIICLEKDGSISRAVEKLKTCGDEVHSLCEPDCLKHFTYSLRKSSEQFPDAILISTDGYFNSFAKTTDYEKVLFDLVQLVKRGESEEISAKLTQWLSRTSKLGSGDDISAILLVNITQLENGEKHGTSTT